jgi:hypothetical protein
MSKRYYVIIPMIERKTNLPDTPVVLAPAVLGDERFFGIFGREPGLLGYIDKRNTLPESRDLVYQLTGGCERGMLIEGADAVEMMEEVEQEKSALSRQLPSPADLAERNGVVQQKQQESDQKASPDDLPRVNGATTQQQRGHRQAQSRSAKP